MAIALIHKLLFKLLFADLDFLPSCTVSHAVRSVFRCEKIFKDLVEYEGPKTCRWQTEFMLSCHKSVYLFYRLRLYYF